jgi:hypothetical protein
VYKSLFFSLSDPLLRKRGTFYDMNVVGFWWLGGAKLMGSPLLEQSYIKYP